MRAEIIAIGTELTTGDKLDTNSQWLSLELAALGLPVLIHTTVADDLPAHVQALRIAAERVDWVIMTGGLGPTLDDLTREAMAQLLQTELVLDEAELAHLRGLFARRQRVMPERNVIQAMFPRGSQPIPNAWGTAPGIYAEVSRPGREPCRIACFPGVPSELKPMFRDWLVPRLKALGPQGVVIQRARINCFGLGESACEELLGEITARGRDPEVGITVHEATITLRIVAHGSSAEECQHKIQTTRAAIHERIGPYIFGEEDEQLQDLVLAQLIQVGQSLSTIEGATGGLLACWLGSAGDAQSTRKALRPSLVLPQPAEILIHPGNDSIPPSDQFTNGTETVTAPPSAEQAVRLAQLIRERGRSDWGLAITAATDDLERLSASGGAATPPRVFVALAGRNTADREIEVVSELNLGGDPAIARSRTAKTALDLLRRELVVPST